MALAWDRVTDALSLPVLGYIVQMIDPITDEWTDVMDESTNQDALSYVHYGVVTESTYTFRAFAVNFNGRSTQIGTQIDVLTCGLPRYMV